MEFSEGQIWKIRTGDYAGVAIHLHKILLHDVIEKSFHISAPSEGVSHMPFSEKALAQSDLYFVSDATNLGADWQEGFDVWNEAFLKGEAGVFSIPVSDAINLIFDTQRTGEAIEPLD